MTAKDIPTHDRASVERVADWLSAGEDNLDKLDAWLCGYELAVPRDDEPWRELLRLVPLTMVPRQYEILARRVGAWLDRLPRLEPDAPMEQRQRAYNALLLAHNLAYPEAVADPLSRLLADRRLDQNTEWFGVRHAHLLLESLIENQVDERHHALWLSIIGGRADGRDDGAEVRRYLGAGLQHGFYGIGLMPPSQDRLTGRNITAIGEALDRCARALADDSENRGPQFRSLLKFAEEQLEGVTDYKGKITKAALRFPLPPWAQLQLSQHVCFLDGGNRILVAQIYENTTFSGLKRIAQSPYRGGLIFEWNTRTTSREKIMKMMNYCMGMEALERQDRTGGGSMTSYDYYAMTAAETLGEPVSMQMAA
ncbi:MAG: hypothetical protein ABT940_07915 [Alphaproteobacteria bacterium]